jgi:uncharacterized coiled-coil protein SlyX
MEPIAPKDVGTIFARLDQQDRAVTELKEVIQRGFKEFREEIASISGRRPSAVAIIGVVCGILTVAATVIISAVAGSLVVVTLVVGQRVDPLKTSVDYYSGMAERMSTALGEQQSKMSEQQRQMAALSSSLAEVETQFDEERNINNLHQVDLQRTFAEIWPKVFDEAYPSQFFAPTSARPLEQR